jgi:hypothetical protein
MWQAKVWSLRASTVIWQDLSRSSTSSGLGVEMGGRWVWLCEKLGSPIVEVPILYRVLTQNSRLQRKDSTNTGTPVCYQC